MHDLPNLNVNLSTTCTYYGMKNGLKMKRHKFEYCRQIRARCSRFFNSRRWQIVTIMRIKLSLGSFQIIKSYAYFCDGRWVIK